MTETVTPEQARDQLLDVIGQLRTETLARLAAHEYDDDAMVPPDGSPGEAFLRACRDDYVAWARREGRFPAEDDEAEAATRWHTGEAPPSEAAQAYVDLGLYLSAHTDYVLGNPSISGLRRALDMAAEQLVVGLTQEYGPLG